MTDPEQLKTAMSHALLVLKNNPRPTTADVRNAATLVVGLMSGMGVTIDRRRTRQAHRGGDQRPRRRIDHPRQQGG